MATPPNCAVGFLCQRSARGLATGPRRRASGARRRAWGERQPERKHDGNKIRQVEVHCWSEPEFQEIRTARQSARQRPQPLSPNRPPLNKGCQYLGKCCAGKRGLQPDSTRFAISLAVISR